MRIDRENTIGLIIDMQEKIYPAMNDKKELLANTSRLILGLQEFGLPLIFTQQYTKGLGDTLTEISKLVGGFSYIEKTAFSCYDEPNFVMALEEKGAKNILIAGIESHVCVLQTAIDLKAAGYNPIIVFDCVSSRTKESKKLALERFRYEGIMVTSYESALFELLRGAKAPEFKTISKLVK